MTKEKLLMGKQKKIALVAHDNKKKEILEWVNENKKKLKNHLLFATGTTGTIIGKETGLDITVFKSGPLGGDQQIGAKIVNLEIDCLLFFWDPLESQPHDPDVKALLRIAALYNIPIATNRSTADFIFKSPLMDEEYERRLSNHFQHINRKIDI